VGITGLALLAFMGNGDAFATGKYMDVIKKGITYLKHEQDYDSGLIGEDISRDFIYSHGIATLAMCEAYSFSKSPLVKKFAQKAINYIQRARNPYAAWSYSNPPVGRNDTSVTGWMLLALQSAKTAKLKVDPDAILNGLQWLDSVTTPESGHAGYHERGSSSARTPYNEHYPREKDESMTAVALACRFALGQDPETTKLDGERIMQHGAELLLTKLPEWDQEGFGCNMYYWYFRSRALRQTGAESWERWNAALGEALLQNQIQVGHAKGSWDPVGPWGYAAGRIYSTALMALCLRARSPSSGPKLASR
jgi:hypothetical protein